MVSQTNTSLVLSNGRIGVVSNFASLNFERTVHNSTDVSIPSYSLLLLVLAVLGASLTASLAAAAMS
jgi:hypothetical protein